MRAIVGVLAAVGLRLATVFGLRQTRLASELDLVDEAIELDRVMQDVSGADLRVVILDACRDNPFGRALAPAPAGA
jgi:hypothetical protein